MRLSKEEIEKEWQPRSLDSYMPTEKIEAFDMLYKVALDHYNEVLESGRSDDDDVHYIFEDVMTLFLGKDVFKSYNKAMG